MKEPNDEAIHEQLKIETPVSQGVMFMTILLLVCGLLLTSAMLMHYGLKQTDENGNTVSGITRALEMMKSSGKDAPPPASPGADSLAKTEAPTPPAPAEKSADEEKSGFNLKDLFGKNNDGSIRWPRLKLAGFGLPSEGEVGFAIINGKHVVEGGSISGVKIIEILEHGVVVEYKGETKTLIVELTH